MLKTDVQRFFGALNEALDKLSTSEVSVKNVANSGVGGITESDINLAASQAILIAFNDEPDVIKEISGRGKHRNSLLQHYL